MRAVSVAAAAVVLSLTTVFSQTTSVAITNVTVVDTAAGAASAGMTVVIRGDRIASIVKGGPAPAGAQVVDGRARFVMPGLWDMHTHLSYARESALPVLAATGVLYARDVGSDLSEIDRWRGEIAAGTLIGPTIVRAGPILNGQAFNPFQLVIANAADARMAARTLKKIGVDVLKTHRRTSRDAYFALADEARALGIPLVGHVPIGVTPEEASNAAQQTIEHVETLFEGTFAAAHGGQVTAAAIEAWRASPDATTLARTFVHNGTVVDPTLVATGYLARVLDSVNPDPRRKYIARSARVVADQMLASVPAAQRATLSQMLHEHEAVTLQLQRAGVTLVTGVDLSVLHPPGFSLHDELDFLSEAGLTPAEILRAATAACAALFPSIGAGAVAPGKRADLVLLNANPLADIRNAHDVNAVILRGRVFHRPALDRLLADAVTRAAVN